MKWQGGANGSPDGDPDRHHAISELRDRGGRGSREVAELRSAAVKVGLQMRGSAGAVRLNVGTKF
jgi:hypothetical protein